MAAGRPPRRSTPAARKTPSAFSRAKPCARASSRPADRSASSTPSPWVAGVDEAAPLVAPISRPRPRRPPFRGTAGGPAGASRRSTRRASVSGPPSAPAPDPRRSRSATRSAVSFCQQLLGATRVADRPTSDDEDARRWALPLDRLDEAGQRRRRAGRASCDGWRGAPSRERRSTAHGSRPPDGVGLGADDGQPLEPSDAGKERDERPRACVGPVQVLDDEQGRPALPEPPHHTEDALQQARLASLRHGRQGVAARFAAPRRVASSGRSRAVRQSPGP